MEMTYKFYFLSLITGLFFLNGCTPKAIAPRTNRPSSPTFDRPVIDSFPLAHKYFTTNRFDALYIVSPDDELQKLNAQHEVEFRYSNSRLGAISSIDVSNPLATLCFFEDFQTIILLDRTLNPLTEIHLADWGFHDVTAVCSSGNNQIWIYDASAMQFVQIAKDRTTPSHTFPTNLHSDASFVISKMLVNKDNLYCLSAKGDLYQLSLIGESLQQILGGKQLTDFQFSGNRLLVLTQQGQIFYYRNPLDLKRLSYPLAQKNKWGFWNGAFLWGNGLELVLVK